MVPRLISMHKEEKLPMMKMTEALTIIGLAKLDPWDYERKRKPAARRLGIREAALDQRLRV
jgi:hypothetical protein